MWGSLWTCPKSRHLALDNFWHFHTVVVTLGDISLCRSGHIEGVVVYHSHSSVKSTGAHNQSAVILSALDFVRSRRALL